MSKRIERETPLHEGVSLQDWEIQAYEFVLPNSKKERTIGAAMQDSINKAVELYIERWGEPPARITVHEKDGLTHDEIPVEEDKMTTPGLIFLWRHDDK